MRKFGTALVALSISLVTPSQARAQDSTKAMSAATVEVAVGAAVAEKALSGAAESFPAGTAKVVCFTKITGAADSEIEHVWYKGDTEVSRVKLSIKGSPFRTWSTKTLPADAKGDWRCDVVQGGKVLSSAKFKVE